MARLHGLAAAGAVRPSELGRPRADPAAAGMLRLLSGRLLAATTAPAIAVAALAHAEVLVWAPFGFADDLVARALERLLLVGRGVDPASVTVPEAGHLALRDGYRAALTAYRSGDESGQRGVAAARRPRLSAKAPRRVRCARPGVRHARPRVRRARPADPSHANDVLGEKTSSASTSVSATRRALSCRRSGL